MTGFSLIYTKMKNIFRILIKRYKKEKDEKEDKLPRGDKGKCGVFAVDVQRTEKQTTIR
jgi:hypothetical protein